MKNRRIRGLFQYRLTDASVYSPELPGAGSIVERFPNVSVFPIKRLPEEHSATHFFILLDLLAAHKTVEIH